LNRIIEIQNEEQCDYILHVGDLFDSYRVSFKLLIDTINFFQKNNLIVHGILGNHDVSSYNHSTINNSALGVLMRLGFYRHVNELKDKLNIKGIDTRLDYKKEDYCNSEIILCHDMITPEENAPFEHLYWKEIDRTVPLIISGHYHRPHIIKGEKTLFVNPGAMMRLSTADTFDPSIDIIDTKDYNVRRIPLNAEPYDSVFRRKEEKKEVLDIGTVELEKIDKGNIIDRIMSYAKENGYSKEVIENALKRVKKAEEEIR
jgi:DNA repair exonuclease SbcCD nuclease subunit